MSRHAVLMVVLLAVLITACSPSGVNETTTAISDPNEGNERPEPTDESVPSIVAPTGDSIVVVVDEIRAVALPGAASRFTAATGVGVSFEITPLDQIRERADDGGVDIFMGPHIWRDELSDAGLLAPVTGLAEEDWTTKAWTAFQTVEGIMAVPFSAESLVLYVNTTTYGPSPPDDLLTACSANVPACFVMPGRGDAGGYHLAAFLMAGSTNTLDEQLAEARSAPGLLAYADLAKSPDHALVPVAEARRDFSEGAMLFVGGPWDLGTIEDSGVEFSVVPVPSVGGLVPSSPVSVLGFYLASTAPRQADAMTFLTEFLASPDTQLDLWRHDRRAPVHGDLTGLGSVAVAFADGVEKGFLLPATELRVYWEELGVAAEQISAGADPFDAVVQAATRISERLGT